MELADHMAYILQLYGDKFEWSAGSTHLEDGVNLEIENFIWCAILLEHLSSIYSQTNVCIHYIATKVKGFRVWFSFWIDRIVYARCSCNTKPFFVCSHIAATTLYILRYVRDHYTS